MRKILCLIVLALATLACTKSAGLTVVEKSTPERAVVGVTVSAPVEILTATPQPVHLETICKVTGDLNIRSGPGMEWGVIGWLYAGESVTVSGAEVGDWLRLKDGGYAHAKYIKCTKE